MIWREKRVLLIILGVLLAANLVYFFTYRVRYQSRLQDREEELAQKETELAQAHTARLRSERSYQSYRKVERDVQQVFNENWATQEERFTQLVAEVKRLAVASNMVPASYGFARIAAPKETGPRRKHGELGASEVGITFGVEGTYEQVRRLINLLELSRQFLIIDEIALAQREGQTLTLNLRLKTLFRDGAPKPAANTRL